MTNTQKKLPFVWELNNHGVISYAVGTMHIAKDQYGEDSAQYVSRAQKLLVERTVPDLMKDPPLFTIPPQDLQEIAHALNIHLPTLVTLPREHHLGYVLFGAEHKNYRGVDFVLQEKARNIPHYSLETPTERAEAMQFIGLQEKINDLLHAERKNPGDAKKLFAGMKLGLNVLMGTYENGSLDNAEFLAKMRQQLGSSGAQENLIKRNQTMVERALPHFENPSVFAVGLAHYLCEGSVLQRFQEKGIAVKRI